MNVPPDVLIRPFAPRNEVACIDIFVDATRNSTTPHYTAEEARAWAPDAAVNWDWGPRLADGWTWVADLDEAPSGFISLRSNGHLDVFYVRPAARQFELADALYKRLLETARESGFTVLTSHASLLAQGFLERRGWRVVRPESALRAGVPLTRFPMRLDDVSR